MILQQVLVWFLRYNFSEYDEQFDRGMDAEIYEMFDNLMTNAKYYKHDKYGQD